MTDEFKKARDDAAIEMPWIDHKLDIRDIAHYKKGADWAYQYRQKEVGELLVEIEVIKGMVGLNHNKLEVLDKIEGVLDAYSK